MKNWIETKNYKKSLEEREKQRVGYVNPAGYVYKRGYPHRKRQDMYDISEEATAMGFSLAVKAGRGLYDKVILWPPKRGGDEDSTKYRTFKLLDSLGQGLAKNLADKDFKGGDAWMFKHYARQNVRATKEKRLWVSVKVKTQMQDGKRTPWLLLE